MTESFQPRRPEGSGAWGPNRRGCERVPVPPSSEKRKVFGIGLEFMRIPGEVQERLRELLYGRIPAAPGARGGA